MVSVLKKKSGILSSSVATLKANLLDIIALERLPIKLRIATTMLTAPSQI